jgi:hypothetical protein
MPPPAPPERPAVARFAQLAAALAMFLCGWLAFRTADWRLTVLYTLLGLGAAITASRLGARGR